MHVWCLRYLVRCTRYIKMRKLASASPGGIPRSYAGAKSMPHFTKLGSIGCGSRCSGHSQLHDCVPTARACGASCPKVLRTHLGYPQRPTLGNAVLFPRLNRKGEICDSSLISPLGSFISVPPVLSERRLDDTLVLSANSVCILRT